jgi:hypothetical protein
MTRSLHGALALFSMRMTSSGLSCGTSRQKRAVISLQEARTSVSRLQLPAGAKRISAEIAETFEHATLPVLPAVVTQHGAPFEIAFGEIRYGVTTVSFEVDGWTDEDGNTLPSRTDSGHAAKVDAWHERFVGF